MELHSAAPKCFPRQCMALQQARAAFQTRHPSFTVDGAGLIPGTRVGPARNEMLQA